MQELIHDFSLGAIICIGAGDGAAALACLHARIPFTGFCLTQEHKTRLRARLEEQLVRGNLKQNSKFYEPNACACVDQHNAREERREGQRSWNERAGKCPGRKRELRRFAAEEEGPAASHPFRRAEGRRPGEGP